MNLLIFYKILKKLQLNVSIKLNRLEEGRILYPLVCRRPAETVSLQTSLTWCVNWHKHHTCVRVDILFTCWRRLYNRIISIRGEAWASKTSWSPRRLLKCLYQAKKVNSHVYLYERHRSCPYFYAFSIRLWDYSDIVAFVGFSFY